MFLKNRLLCSSAVLAAAAALSFSPSANAQCGGFAQATIINEVNPGEPYVQGQDVDIQVVFGPSGLQAGQQFRVDRVLIRLDCAALKFCSDTCNDAGELLTFVAGSLTSSCPTLQVFNVSGNVVELRPNPAGSLILDPGSTCLFTFTVNIANIGSEDTITGSVQMDGFCLPQNIAGGGCGTYIIPVTAPEINIVKEGAPSPTCEGSQVTYTYTVTNPGAEPLFDVCLRDDNGTPGNPADDVVSLNLSTGLTCDPTLTQAINFTGGDANSNNMLDPGETWTYTYVTTVTGTVTNIVTVNGSIVTAQGTVTVDDTDNEIIVVNPLPTCTIVPTPGDCETMLCVETDACEPFTVTWTDPSGNVISNDPCITLTGADPAGQYCATVVDCNGCETDQPCCFTFTPPAGIDCTISAPTSDCEPTNNNPTYNAGSTVQFCVVPAGGTGPFTYSWSLGSDCGTGWSISGSSTAECVNVVIGEQGSCCTLRVEVFDANLCKAKCILTICSCVDGGGEGCTPGFWKQAHHFGHWPEPYIPHESCGTPTLFCDVFDCGNPPHSSFANLTLLQVLKRGGGGFNALGRHAVAALLNAASEGVESDFTVDEVIAMVNAAIASGQTQPAHQQLADANEQGCPLSGQSFCSDLNRDGMVNHTDLNMLMANWGNPGLGDLNDSGKVNGQDVSILLSNWGNY